LALCAEHPPPRARRIVARECRQIDAGDRAQQPGGLPILLDCAPAWQGGGAALNCATVDSRILDPTQLQWAAGVAIGVCDRRKRRDALTLWLFETRLCHSFGPSLRQNYSIDRGFLASLGFAAH